MKIKWRWLYLAIFVVSGFHSLGAKEAPLPKIRGYAVVQLYLGGLNRLGLETTINGEKVVFLLDTGANLSAIDQDAVNKLGLTPPAVAKGVTSSLTNNGKKVKVVWLPDFQSGQMNFGPGPMSVLPGGSFSKEYFRAGMGKLQGLFGWDILHHYKAVLNCQTRQLYFKTDPTVSSNIGPVLAKAGYKSVKLREKNGQFFVPCLLKGREYWFFVDTGAYITSIRKDQITGLGIKSKATLLYESIVFGKPHQIEAVEAGEHQLSIAGVPITETVGLVDDSLIGAILGKNVLGILGCEILGVHGAVLDFDQEMFYIRP